MSFSSLPLELVGIILEICRDDRGSLFNLSLVNRGLNREAEVIMYRSASLVTDNPKDIGFFAAVSKSQERANHLQSLSLMVSSEPDDNIHHLIYSAIPRFSQLYAFCFFTWYEPWIFRNLPPSLYHLDIYGMECGPIFWDLLRSLPNLGHLSFKSAKKHHTCNFPNDILPNLSSFDGNLTCMTNILSNRPVTDLIIGEDVDTVSVHEYMNAITRSRAEITFLDFRSVFGIGETFLAPIAEHCPSLVELIVRSSSEEQFMMPLEKPENWGNIFRRSKSLKIIEIFTGSKGIPHENAGLIVTSWAEACPQTSDLILNLSDDANGTCYHYQRVVERVIITTWGPEE